jgi:L-ascorbate 6-phosphate lactonase
MTTDVARSLRRLGVPARSLAIFWLGQAGFALKTPDGKVIYIDPYLTDSVERTVGFKRLMPSVVSPREVRADAVLISHHHEDHLDVDALPVIARRTAAQFVAPPRSAGVLATLGVPADRVREVRPGAAVDLGFAVVRAVFADHGDLAPDAVGFVVDFGFTRVYATGDTAYRPRQMAEAAGLRPAVLIAVINGAYGNLGPQEAANLACDVGAKVVIPCHFWTFIEHGGDPAAFVKACRETAPQARVALITQGGWYTYTA